MAGYSAENFLSNGIFSVSIEGVELSFSRVSGISSSIQYDTYVEGGGRMHLLTKPKTDAGTITFEKGVSLVDSSVTDMLRCGMTVSDITVRIESNKYEAEEYYIENGLVVSWETGDLNGLADGVIVKKFTIAHSGLKRI